MISRSHFILERIVILFCGGHNEKMTDLITYREKRRQDSMKKFLNGEARRAYVLREDISCGLKEQTINRFGKKVKT